MKRLSSSGKPHKATKEKVVFKSCELFCNPIQWEKYLRLWFPTSGFTSILPPNSVKISLPLKTIHCSHWKAAAGAQVICPTKKKKSWTEVEQYHLINFTQPPFTATKSLHWPTVVFPMMNRPLSQCWGHWFLKN